jgi:uncharacterized protein (DUF2252 family)
MAGDLAGTPVTGLRVQACDDAHLANFGVFGAPERNLVFDVNDFDETLPATWEWDVKRLAASVVLAARNLQIGDQQASQVVRGTVRSYRERMAELGVMGLLDVWYDRVDIAAVLAIARQEGAKDLKRQLRVATIRPVGFRWCRRPDVPRDGQLELATPAKGATAMNRILRANAAEPA